MNVMVEDEDACELYYVKGTPKKKLNRNNRNNNNEH